MDVNESMKLYYELRAEEYDDWYERKEKYNKGAELNELWFKDVLLLKEHALNVKGMKILEIASGTGMWTQHLMVNNEILPTDFSESMLRMNHQRTGIQGIQLDAMKLENAPQGFDTCFFGFWLSHVEIEKMDQFFQGLSNIAKNVRVIIFDSYFNNKELNCLNFENNIQKRALKNGQVFDVYKKYYSEAELQEFGEKHFSSYQIETTPSYFYVFDGILKY